MKAIETRWKGYRFRSRTEARWAVFLDALAVTFEYEPEGVVLPSGPYLPDFRLRSFPVGQFPGGRAGDESVWLEIKGGEPSESEMQRCVELARETGEPVLLASGSPDFTPQVLLFDNVGDNPAAELLPHLIGQLTFLDVGRGVEAALAVGRPARPDPDESSSSGVINAEEAAVFNEMWRLYSGPFARVLGVSGARFVSNNAIDFQLSDRVKRAYDAARSARFEFGQTDPRWPS